MGKKNKYSYFMDNMLNEATSKKKKSRGTGHIPGLKSSKKKYSGNRYDINSWAK